MIPDVDELIKAGDIDITTRAAVEDMADRDARAAEPDAYALTYEESITIKQAHNTVETVLIQNDYITTDETTGARAFVINPESTGKIMDAFAARGIDPDEIYTLANRVLADNWFTFIPVGAYSAGKEELYLVANVNGKRDEGILHSEDYPAVYDGSSFTAKRDALKLPKDAGFLFTAELDFLTTLRQVCNPQLSIEEKIGRLSPYATMPNAASFTTVSRFMHNPHITPKDATSTKEDVTFMQGENDHEYKTIITTPNTTVTLTIADIYSFFDIDIETTSGGKKRRGTLGGVNKVWRFALQKLMQQSTAHTTPEAIMIDLEEMVSVGMFSNADNAYRAIDTMIKKMGLLHIAQDFPCKNGKKTQGGFLFYHSERDNNRARIYVNQKFGFEFFRRQYTYFPTSWAYKLNGNAFSLTEYLFSMMRQRKDEIAEKGKFRIKLTTIHNQLGLRSIEDVRENSNRRYNDYIKKPIMQAVDEVNAAAKTDKEITGRFKVAIKATDTGSIEDWLAGYLEISATGDYISHLNSIADPAQLLEAPYKERPEGKRRARSKASKKTVEK